MKSTALKHNWKKSKLGAYFQIKHGYAFKGEFFANAGPYVLLTPGNFKAEGGITLKREKEKYYTGDFPKEFLLKRDDFLIVLTDLIQNAPILGSPAFILEDGKFLHNQRLGKVVNLNTKEMDILFLYYILNSKNVRDQIRGSATGSTVRHTAPERIYAVDVEIPPLPTQRKIAAILSAYDDLIENNTRRIVILEEMAQALYREWFVHFRFPGSEKKSMVESALGMIPEGWEIKSFAEVAEFINGYAFKPEDWGKVGKPIVKIAELKNGVADKTPFHDGSIPSKYHIQSGDLLFSWSADLDVYVWSGGPALLNQHLFNVVPYEGFTKLFLFFSLKERMWDFRSKSQGTTMKHIKRAALEQVYFWVPAVETRLNFEEKVQPILANVQNLTEKNATLRRTRDLLLPKLISGELDVEGLAIALGGDDDGVSVREEEGVMS